MGGHELDASIACILELAGPAGSKRNYKEPERDCGLPGAATGNSELRTKKAHLLRTYFAAPRPVF